MLVKPLHDDSSHVFDTQFKIAADYDFVLRVLSRPELQRTKKVLNDFQGR